jgi:inorganic phosphate transporter, PiT family
MIIAIIFIAFIFDFLNGMRDASNFVSTMVVTRAMAPRLALWLTACAEFIGPFLIGTRVANAFSGDLIMPDQIDPEVILAALLSCVIWNLITLRLALPSSSSHAFFGGIIGSAFAGGGLQIIHHAGVIKILISLLLSPFAGFFIGFLMTRLVFFFSMPATPFINTYFRSAQVITGVTLAVSYGANDAQKSMGAISLALLSLGYMTAFSIPSWVVALSAGATALGIAIGGWRLVNALGYKFYRVRPVHGFTSQFTSIGIILVSALLGAPVSTSQVVTTSILGAGSADRANMIRWLRVSDILRAWLLTIPLCAFLGFLFYHLLIWIEIPHGM